MASRLLLRSTAPRTLFQHRFKSTRPEPSSSSLTNQASSFLAGLRWKAANALTASLSESERKQLLERLHPPPPKEANVVLEKKNEEDEVLTKSISEAVAEAKAQEAQRLTSKWEKEKADIMKEAERAAQARVESDLAIQKRRLGFEQWKQELEKEQSHDTASSSSSITEKAEIEEDHHPLLGPALVDLGYKRIHVASAKTLASIPVWKKQRIYRHDRAKEMAKDKMKTLHLGMPGVIGLHEDLNGKLSILDGQHRVGMMTILEQKQKDGTLDLDRILVEVYPQQQDHDDSHAQDLFLEVNKAEPVKLVDMPGIAKSTDRKTINEGASKLRERYPDMFSASQKCRTPHLNIDNLRDALFASDAIQRHGLKNAKALEEWMLEQNELMAQKYSTPEAQKKVSKTAMTKAQKFNFYLGLDSSWYYN